MAVPGRKDGTARGPEQGREKANEWISLFWREAVVGGSPGGAAEIVVDLNRQGIRVESGMAKMKIKATMRSIPHGQKNELRANLLELSEACPFHHDNPEDCPLFALRRMEPRKRVQWFDALIEDDLVYLANYHRVCFTTKVESGLAKQRINVPAKRGPSRDKGQ